MKTLIAKKTLKACIASSLMLFALVGCESDDEGSGEGYVKLYNLSKDSPSIYLTVDADITTDNDDDGHYEQTYSSVPYGSAHSNIGLTNQEYDFQLAWQDSDSSYVDDLSIIYEGKLPIAEDTIQMVVLSESVLSPQVTVFNMPVIDDEDDTTYDRFNLRVLNMHSNQQAVDFYLSKEDETFNEAELVGQFEYQQLSDNQKRDQDDYIFYITLAGSDEVLFTSSSIPFEYSSQNIMVVRDNNGAGTSNYILDKMSDSFVIEYVDAQAEAEFRVYNAVDSHDELFTYQEEFALHINGVSDTPIVSSLAFGEISSALRLASGDYSLDITTAEENAPLLSNHLLSVTENTNKTVFIYAEQEYVDNDSDGNIDENDDGIIDEIDVNLFTLVVENSLLSSIYEHEIEIVNLIQSDDFTHVDVFFVRQSETIETALYNREINYKNTRSIMLKNNTYQVFVLGNKNGSSIILNSFELELNESSSELFLVLETSDDAPTGYKKTLFTQLSDNNLEQE